MKKIILSILVIASGVMVSSDLISGVNKQSLTLDNLVASAYAQNSENIPGDPTWNDVADFLDWLNTYGGSVEQSEWEDEFFQACTDFAHAACDMYDLTGDPVSEWQQSPDGSTWANVQVDDCDGQPNAC